MEESVRVDVPSGVVRELERALATREERFVAVSAALTGFDRVELLGTGVAPLYLATLDKWVGPDIAGDLLGFGTDPLPDERTVRAGILSDAKLGPVARNLMALWYNGTWSPLPSAWYRAYGAEIPNGPDVAALPPTYVVSGQAYIESLVWAAANTHPMGAKQPGYGTWEEQPARTRR